MAIQRLLLLLSAQQTPTAMIGYISLLSYAMFMIILTLLLSTTHITTTAASTASINQPISQMSPSTNSHIEEQNNSGSAVSSLPPSSSYAINSDGRLLTDNLSTDVFVSSGVTALPFGGTVKSSCEAGKRYTITSMKQLEELKDEIHCVMSVGFAPDVLPLGPAPGKSIMVLNTDFWNTIGNKFYQGQFYTESKCNGKNYTFDFSRSVPGFSVTTALLSLGNFDEELMDGETFDGGPCLITDYTVSAADLCGKAEGSEADWRVTRMSPYFNNIWPFKNVKYCVRIVGCDSDGAFLMLKRSFIRSDLTGKYFTLLYAALKSYDTRLSTTWKCGDPIGPTKAEEYMRMGAPTFVAHFAPLAAKLFKHSIFKDAAMIGPMA
eukprot:GHVS01026123.1.p1 GENE.GHVS01026123.1~~GHVS01026123.1.p1  ORF type:complete len:378 (+),score=56.47 GHVS01026123.1:213-1346(+)